MSSGRTIFFSVLLLLLALRVIPQTVNFYNITTADGLSHPIVNTIGQDKLGFIWIGTAEGLNVFDGDEFTVFSSKGPNNTFSSETFINDLCFDDDYIWVAGSPGLSRIHTATRIIEKLDQFNNYLIRTIYREPESPFLWIGTNTGLIRYNIGNQTHILFNTANSNISHDRIRAIYKDSDENLWIGTFDQLNKLVPNSSVFSTYDLKGSYMPQINNNLVVSILPYSDENDSLLWIGTETGLILFHRQSGIVETYRTGNSRLLNETIKVIHRSESGNLFLGTDFGLYKLTDSHELIAFTHNPHDSKSLINGVVWEIFEDDSGVLWFGTNNGISLLSPNSKEFQFFPVSLRVDDMYVGHEVLQIIQDAENHFWLATQNGIIQYDTDQQTLQPFLPDYFDLGQIERKTRSIFEDDTGRLWIGTLGGLLLWDARTQKMQQFTHDLASGTGLRSNYIQSIFQSQEGQIYVNTGHGGLHRVVEHEGNIGFVFLGDFGNNQFIIGNKHIYTYAGGSLVKIDKVTYERNTENVFRGHDGARISIQAMTLANDSIIWLGAKNRLIRYNIETRRANHYTIKSDKNYSILCILIDHDANVWLSSFDAIIKFSAEDESFVIYPSGHDIPVSRFQNRSCYVCREGELLFGSQNGFIRFNPKRITKTDYTPRVVITRLFVNNQEFFHEPGKQEGTALQTPVCYSGKITLKHSERFFALHFSSLHYGNRNGIRYAYKLDGTDADWRYITGQAGIVNYANLQPGTYAFRLMGTNTDGVWNPNETTLTIRVKPPLWASTGFVLLYFVVFAALTFAIVSYFINRGKIKNELLVLKLEAEYTSEISNVRQQFFTNISHEYNTPLSLIVGPAKKLLQIPHLGAEVRKFVQLIENNSRRLLWLNNQLLEFIQVENNKLSLNINQFDVVAYINNVFSFFSDKASRKNTEYAFHTDFDTRIVSMDERKLEAILFNLLSNAFKFTPKGGKIDLFLSHVMTGTGHIDTDYISITVKDTGIGIAEEDTKKVFDRFFQTEAAKKMKRGAGIGLSMVDEYVKLLQGQIMIKSKPGEGTEFHVVLPVTVNVPVNDAADLQESSPDSLLSGIHESAYSEQTDDAEYSDKPLILVVEDDKEMADFIRMSFCDTYCIVTAGDGKEALIKLERRLPDLIVCDLVMPEMDGIAFTRLVKRNQKTALVPVIMITGQTSAEEKKLSYQSGADAYLVKPLEIDLLAVRIESLLKRNKKLDEVKKTENYTKPRERSILSQDERVLEKIIATIEKHISDPDLQVATISKDTGFSYYLISQRIKKLTGLNANKFIQTIRLRQAEKLLKSNKYSISEVIDHTGFTSHSYFSKCFKQFYRMSPKEYQEKNSLK